MANDKGPTRRIDKPVVTGNPKTKRDRDETEQSPFGATPFGTGNGIPARNDPDGNGVGSSVGDSRTANTEGEKQAGAPKETLEIEPQKVSDPPPKTSHKKGQGKSSKAKEKDDADAAKGLMEMVEIFAVARFGSAAKFNDQERFLIESPLTRLIEKYGDVSDRFSGIIDPAMVAAGVIVYSIRLASMVETKTPVKPTPMAKPAVPAPNGNGKHDPLPSAPDGIFDILDGRP